MIKSNSLLETEPTESVVMVVVAVVVEVLVEVAVVVVTVVVVIAQVEKKGVRQRVR